MWQFDPDPTRGREQMNPRPGIVLSADWYNAQGTGMVAIVPTTGTNRGFPLHVEIGAGTGGLDRDCVAMCDQVRAITVDRLLYWRGTLPPDVLLAVERAVADFLDLPIVMPVS